MAEGEGAGGFDLETDSISGRGAGCGGSFEGETGSEWDDGSMRKGECKVKSAECKVQNGSSESLDIADGLWAIHLHFALCIFYFAIQMTRGDGIVRLTP